MDAGDDFIERAVAAHGHHGVVIPTLLGGNADRVPGGGGAADAKQVSGIAQGGSRVI